MDDDNISESSSTEDNEQSNFAIIPPDLDELTNEKDFNENVLLLGENLEIPKDKGIISKQFRRNLCTQKKENILWEICTHVFSRKSLDLYSME
ncbi:hypothetical protein TNCT_449531 [Trichonephila clavata]|uniref:Uncharacterized protein n=1 Tax=Trichonephila clavata TaxID=2740835 RepID=A0A8X6L6P7_TRICU|nr:hypothetical protein TNCT_449531 [Trichonephila clavata]